MDERHKMFRWSSILLFTASSFLLCGNTSANVFKSVEKSCKQNNVHCLGVNSYTYCLNRDAGSFVLKFEFNCPRNYVCDETAKYPCVKDANSILTPISIQITPPQTDLPNKTDSKLLNKIIEDFIASLPSGADSLTFENNVLGRVPLVKISADDSLTLLDSDSIIISPTTSSPDEENPLVIITPDPIIIFPNDNNGDLMDIEENSDIIIQTTQAPSSPSLGGSVIIIPGGSTPSPSESVIITPDATATPPDGIIITPDDATPPPSSSTSSPGSVIITPNETVAPPSGSIIVTPDSTAPPGNIIISGNSFLTGPVYFMPPPGETRIDSDKGPETVGPQITPASIIILPTTTPAPDPRLIITPTQPPGGGIIITPSTTMPPGGGVIITPSTTMSPGGGVIITPSTTIPPGGGVIITPTSPPGTPPNCITTGKHWGPSCSQYYECILVWWWYEYRLQSCATGLYFSYSKQICVTPLQSECV